MRFSKKALIATGTGAVVAMAVGGLALAYWTTTGSGDGTATNSAGNGSVTLHATFADDLTPGATENVSYTADNATSSSTKLSTLTVGSITTSVVGCSAGDFSASAPVLVVDPTVGPNSTDTVVANGTITFADTTSNQDLCKSAVITLHLSSS